MSHVQPPPSDGKIPALNRYERVVLAAQIPGPVRTRIDAIAELAGAIRRQAAALGADDRQHAEMLLIIERSAAAIQDMANEPDPDAEPVEAAIAA